MLSKFYEKNVSNNAKIYPTLNYILRFDGCSKGNPGIAGCGAVIYHENEEVWFGYYYIGDKITNNYSEYSGLILGLQQAIKMGIDSLLVEGDSQLVINQMNNVYKCKSPNLIPLYETAKELSSTFKIIQLNHIYRNKNKRADELSNLGVNKISLNKVANADNII
jgi:ribonuclease HI